MSNYNYYVNVKAIIAFLIVCLNASLFFMFTYGQINMTDEEQLRYFVSLAIIGGAFFVTLLYLVSNSKIKKVAAETKHHKVRRGSSKKKKK